MTYEIRHNCDRCGKKLGYSNEFPVKRHKRIYWTAQTGSKFFSLSGSNHITKEFDLCFDCENKLIQFLNGTELAGEEMESGDD